MTSAESLPVADGAFDAAMAVLTIHHWRMPEIYQDLGYRLLVRELARADT